MKVTLLCSDNKHPVYPYLRAWREANKDKYKISLISDLDKLQERGDILFLVSCTEIINAEKRKMFKHALVLHASDLPKGRGWSPHIWDIVSGKNELMVSLINAEDNVDTGDIWKKISIKLKGTELYDEINKLLFEAEVKLISWACANILKSKPKSQESGDFNYYRKRTPEDSELDINKSIKDQFNLLRVCDPNRFPAFIKLDDQKFKVILEKYDEE